MQLWTQPLAASGPCGWTTSQGNTQKDINAESLISAGSYRFVYKITSKRPLGAVAVTAGSGCFQPGTLGYQAERTKEGFLEEAASELAWETDSSRGNGVVDAEGSLGVRAKRDKVWFVLERPFGLVEEDEEGLDREGGCQCGWTCFEQATSGSGGAEEQGRRSYPGQEVLLQLLHEEVGGLLLISLVGLQVPPCFLRAGYRTQVSWGGGCHSGFSIIGLLTIPKLGQSQPQLLSSAVTPTG